MAKVLQIKQSPLNVQRWCCILDCGHDQWITQKQKPTRKTLVCERCNQLVAVYHGDVDGDCGLA